jgi:hypothetical protein
MSVMQIKVVAEVYIHLNVGCQTLNKRGIGSTLLGIFCLFCLGYNTNEFTNEKWWHLCAYMYQTVRSRISMGGVTILIRSVETKKN